MKPKALLLTAVSLLAAGLGKNAAAQGVPPSYTASPDVYKLLSENEQFRVILSVWQPGQTDLAHSHAGAFTAYYLTDCKLEITGADGRTELRERARGSVTFGPVIATHTAKNIGPTECQVLLVEKK